MNEEKQTIQIVNDDDFLEEEWDMESETPEDESFEEEENIDDKAQIELEENDIYFMILHSDMSRGMGITPEGMEREDELMIARNEGELLARYNVDKSFAKQLISDPNFKDAVRSLRNGDLDECGKSEVRQYIPTLQIVFENRYEYICTFIDWNITRSKYLKLGVEKEGVEKFFQKEQKRFRDSIPQKIPDFKKWGLAMDEVVKLLGKDIIEETTKGNTWKETGDKTTTKGMTIGTTPVGGNDKPDIKQTILSQSTSTSSVSLQQDHSQISTISMSPQYPTKKRKKERHQ